MISCDYLIIGSGFAGIGLKYKLLGKTILIDRKPFQYKIGESHIPELINAEPSLLSLTPKIMKMKSFTKKLGTIFCDSYHGNFATNFEATLGPTFAWHCEREELEKLLVKELSIEIKQETIVDINLAKNLVVTDKNEYHFKKYLLDCSGPSMVIANKLNLVAPIDAFKGMKAQWSYWTIDRLNNDKDSWAHWTVLNKIASDSWIWQIPIYNSSILSMGILHRMEPLSDDELLKYTQERSAACYKLTSIVKNPQKAIKPYMKKVHSRLHYSRRSEKCSGKNWILVGDAYCFADPVYSVGSGVAMLEAITVANNLNFNKGKFDHVWYEEKCNALLKTVIDGIGTWYSGTAFDKKINREVNRTILRGGFSRLFRPSKITENAKEFQRKQLNVFRHSSYMMSDTEVIKSYYFDRKAFIKTKNSLVINCEGKSIRITNKNVRKVFETHLIGKGLSSFDLNLIVELNLPTLEVKSYFWNVIRCIELVVLKSTNANQLYYFHPHKYEIIAGQLRLGDRHRHLMIKDPLTIGFFEQLKGKILSEQEIIKLVDKSFKSAEIIKKQVRVFLQTFKNVDTFGQNIVLSQKRDIAENLRK